MPKRHAEQVFSDHAKRRLIDQLSALSLEARFPESRRWVGSDASDHGVISDGRGVGVDQAVEPTRKPADSSSFSASESPAFVIDPAYLKIPASVTESSAPGRRKVSTSLIPYIPWQLVLWNNLMSWLYEQGIYEPVELDMDDGVDVDGDSDDDVDIDLNGGVDGAGHGDDEEAMELDG